MPKHISQEDLESIIEVVATSPNGIGIEKIYLMLEGRITRRTLQRRLALLVEQKSLIKEGRARATHYRLPIINGESKIEEEPDIPTPIARQEVYISLSTSGEECKKAIRKPIQHRRPVGYNRNFLDSYRPNSTFYLTAEIRQQLFEIGRSPEENRIAGTYARQIYNRLLVDLSWNSSRLEGNTYSLLETERLLELGEAAEGKKAMETQMLLNHKDAIELLVEQAVDVGFNRYTILNLHALLSNNLLTDPQACGRLRAVPVLIGGSVFHPLEIPQLIDECFGQILSLASEIEDPFEQAFFAMVHLPYLQPFLDVNKRVSRLAANIPLIRRNLCPLSFLDVPDQAYIDGTVAVYELNKVELLRDVFVWAYQRSCARYSATRQSLGSPDPFRLRYRQQIKDIVAEVVRGCMDKREAAHRIASCSESGIPPSDQPRFIEVVETELSNLHEGNFARYGIRPLEFSNWEKIWR
ncbi:Fic family protein [Desulfopila sp. IMCC35008]|uniref:Fic family protein n=1 Tax=Desulfopila sp. IMCC35008 TaxID=2653858 RepID=UPI0013D71655|nr:Fic family protein [Desulfopila sp. IMCC35008]